MADLPLMSSMGPEHTRFFETMERFSSASSVKSTPCGFRYDDLILLYPRPSLLAYASTTKFETAVMKMLADTRGIKIDDKDKKELTEKFSTMPPHPEVPAALRASCAMQVFRLHLTDNLLEVQTRQLEHGGMVDLFERRLSADGVTAP